VFQLEKKCAFVRKIVLAGTLKSYVHITAHTEVFCQKMCSKHLTHRVYGLEADPWKTRKKRWTLCVGVKGMDSVLSVIVKLWTLGSVIPQTIDYGLCVVVKLLTLGSVRLLKSVIIKRLDG